VTLERGPPVGTRASVHGGHARAPRATTRSPQRNAAGLLDMMNGYWANWGHDGGRSR
jgi:hypothetical protein